MFFIKGSGSKIWNTTKAKVDQILFTKTYVHNPKTDFCFLLNRSPAHGTVPDQVSKMDSHGGVARIDVYNEVNMYLLTHNPPLGVPSVKLDNVDFQGNKKDQYLVGPFRLAKGDTDFAGVADSAIAPKHFFSKNLSPHDLAKLNRIKNYITLGPRDDIKEFFISPIKEVILLKKQLGQKQLNYRQTDDGF